MARITVLGGTGYTGAQLVREAAARGHEVRSISRNPPRDPIAGVTYDTASLLDDAARQRAVDGADVVLGALAARGELEPELRGAYARLAELAAQSGARWGVIGGFSSLRLASDAPRIAAGDLPPQFAAEARTMVEVLDDLEAEAPEALDWFFVSPAADYGAHVPGVATGTYRLGSDVALFDADGASVLSGPDLATAVIDEIDVPRHRRTQFSVVH